ncbi:MAG: class I SAM-dependent methyltransferase [Sphingorhabdus sp.]
MAENAVPNVYRSGFFQRQNTTSARSASRIVPFVTDLIAPKSVLDAGCGSGAWSKAFLENDVPSLRAIDGDYARASLLIDDAHFTSVNLASFDGNLGAFDLVACIEVAEHLNADRAAGFVQLLCKHSPAILFSAAPPGQGGTHHVNEQPLSYWVEHFAQCGYRLFDIIRPAFWHDDTVQWWHRQNMVIFADAKNQGLIDILEQKRTGTPALTDVIHPDAFEAKTQLSAVADNALNRVRRRFGT